MIHVALLVKIHKDLIDRTKSVYAPGLPEMTDILFLPPSRGILGKGLMQQTSEGMW